MAHRPAVPDSLFYAVAAVVFNVLILQDALNALGYSTQTLDGVFGGNTRNALVAYQRDNGLSADGVVGCGTWTRIVNEVVGIGRTPTVIDP